jgi:hypothetical protein
MMTTPHLAQLLAETRMQDTLRETEDERRLRRAFGPRRTGLRGALSGLLGRTQA